MRKLYIVAAVLGCLIFNGLISKAQTNIWLGQNNAWLVTANWSTGIIPTNTTNVVIPFGVIPYPIISTAAQACNNLDIAPGATLTLTSATGAKLVIAGDITNTGLIDATVGTLELNGTAPQTIVSSVFKDKTIKNLIISNNVSIGGIANTDTIKVTGTVSFGASSKTFTTNNNLTLISNAAGTAGIGDLTAGGTLTGNSISGNANVERYISAGRKWRFIAINTEGSQTIQNSWMEKQAPGVQGPTGYGEWITDPVPTNFDGVSFTPSMKYLSGNTYVPVTDPTIFDIKSQSAYMTYVRGDRTATNVNATAPETVLRTYGALTQGQKVFTIASGASNFTVVGNPYASAVNLKAASFSNSGITNIYIWNPALGGAYTLGGYQPVYNSGPGTDFIVAAPGGSGYPGVGAVMNTIESGLAFLVQGRATNQTITFDELSKGAYLNQVFFTASAPKIFYATLAVKENGAITPIDGSTATFDAAFSNNVDADDAVKMSNASENVSFRRNSSFLAIERRKMPQAEDTLFVNLEGLAIKDYQWTFKLTNMDAPGLSGFVKDSYLNTTTPLNLNGDNVMDFSVTADAGSRAAGRFMIILKPTVVVPVALQIISAVRQADKSVQVKWKAHHESNIARYEAERSTNGTLFTKISTTPPTNSSSAGAAYSATDPQPLDGVNYYRVKAVDADGDVTYTDIVKVAAVNLRRVISVSPNPVKSKVIHLQIESLSAGEYSLQLINTAGAIIYTQILKVSGEVFTKEIQLGKQAAAGSYRLLLTGNDGKANALNVIIE